jgi:uncharacterized protein (UPF0332 family)
MSEGQKSLLQSRLSQARESLDDAKILLIQDAEVNFVMNSVYYAFFYPVSGLLQTRGITAPMQSVAIALFEKEFVQPGTIERRFFNAIQKAFELRPACACEDQKKATPQDIEELFPIAEDFHKRVQELIGRDSLS